MVEIPAELFGQIFQHLRTDYRVDKLALAQASLANSTVGAFARQRLFSRLTFNPNQPKHFQASLVQLQKALIRCPSLGSCVRTVVIGDSARDYSQIGDILRYLTAVTHLTLQGHGGSSWTEVHPAIRTGLIDNIFPTLHFLHLNAFADFPYLLFGRFQALEELEVTVFIHLPDHFDLSQIEDERAPVIAFPPPLKSIRLSHIHEPEPFPDGPPGVIWLMQNTYSTVQNLSIASPMDVPTDFYVQLIQLVGENLVCLEVGFMEINIGEPWNPPDILHLAALPALEQITLKPGSNPLSVLIQPAITWLTLGLTSPPRNHPLRRIAVLYQTVVGEHNPSDDERVIWDRLDDGLMSLPRFKEVVFSIEIDPDGPFGLRDRTLFPWLSRSWEEHRRTLESVLPMTNSIGKLKMASHNSPSLISSC
ncbi:hypothetical protein DL96DRAFT_1682705 [Flagelloscypha sp. PMI_526]|nr:hypothetical protein DL96DRAFT_1682705 [Flagelloscypha sp. PMI_526]